MPTIEDVSHAAADLVFGKSLIQNNFRAVIAETIVGFALGADWSHCSDNWNSWDFEHKTGARLEVKQSARKQTWSKSKLSEKPGFDIASRQGYWLGDSWIDEVGRHADIYVFAFHPGDDELTDHRDPSQWLFYVVDAVNLSLSAKSIRLSVLKKDTFGVAFGSLREEVEKIRLNCESRRINLSVPFLSKACEADSH